MAKIIISILLIFSGFQSHSQIAMFHAHNFTAENLLLDDNTAVIAFSLRKLKSSYTGSAIRVRRSSDNTEQDIGFTVNGDLDTVSLKSFTGSSSAFVTTWYNQVNTSNNATQTTQANQPRIVNAGVIERQGAMPALLFDGVNDLFTMNPIVSSVNTNWSTFYVHKKRTTGVNGLFFSGIGNGFGSTIIMHFSDNNVYIRQVSSTSTNGATLSSVSDNTAIFSLVEGYNVSGSVSAYKNNVAYTFGTPTNGTVSAGLEYTRIGQYGTIAQYTDGKVSEIIHYNQDKTSQRTLIISNINSYYSIY